MVCPPLDGLATSEVYAMDPEYNQLIQMNNLSLIVNKLKQMVTDEDCDENDANAKIHSFVLGRVSGYMNKEHPANYILYNLYKDRQFDDHVDKFHQIMEYPFPKANFVEGLAVHPGALTFSTAPPTLMQLFLSVLEMASWINLSDEKERKVVLLHQPDMHSSTPTLVAACLVSLIYKDLFLDGPTEALPFIKDLA